MQYSTQHTALVCNTQTVTQTQHEVTPAHKGRTPLPVQVTYICIYRTRDAIDWTQHELTPAHQGRQPLTTNYIYMHISDQRRNITGCNTQHTCRYTQNATWGDTGTQRANTSTCTSYMSIHIPDLRRNITGRNTQDTCRYTQTQHEVLPIHKGRQPLSVSLTDNSTYTRNMRCNQSTKGNNLELYKMWHYRTCF